MKVPWGQKAFNFYLGSDEQVPWVSGPVGKRSLFNLGVVECVPLCPKHTTWWQLTRRFPLYWNPRRSWVSNNFMSFFFKETSAVFQCPELEAIRCHRVDLRVQRTDSSCWDVGRLNKHPKAENPWPPTLGKDLHILCDCGTVACLQQGVLVIVCSYRFERNSHWVNTSYPNSSTCVFEVSPTTLACWVLKTASERGKKEPTLEQRRTTSWWVTSTSCSP